MQYDDDQEDGWTEDTTNNGLPVGCLDTLMMPEVPQEEQLTFSFAPGEGNKPLGLFMDKYSEELSFPTIYCGKAKPSSVDKSIPYAEELKSELRRKDRRVASSIPNIFFKTKKMQIKRLLDTSNVCLRRNKIRGRVTAGQVKGKTAIENIISHDDGFRAGKNLKGSPWYWENAKKDLFAMIRQLGMPTYFVSLSCADTHWPDLIRLLG